MVDLRKDFHWGGNQEQWGALTNYGMVEIDSGDAIVQPVEGSKYLKIKSETGSVGLYRYFQYSPGDTLEYTFSYYVRPLICR